MRRYTAYSANQVITTTATTSRISKNSTTAEKSSRPQPTVPGGYGLAGRDAPSAELLQLTLYSYSGQNEPVAAPMK